jgi:D-serine deaminase-like pyridoxal phosphate-dependent protein
VNAELPQPETPCVVIDRTVLERNLRRFQSYCDEHGLRFRPHVKTHKSLEIAELQLSLGASGLTCQKLSEAETFARLDAPDLMVGANVVGRKKLERLAALARRTRVSVTVDNAGVGEGVAAAAQSAGTTIGVWVDCDTGLERTGVQSPREALELGSVLGRLPNLELAGLFAYPTPPEGSWFEEAVAAWTRDGLPGGSVSVGGTPGAFETHRRGYATELRAGTYVFMDLYCLQDGTADVGDCALTVHATCVSRPTPYRAVLDAGSKALGLDRVDLGAGEAYGLLKGPAPLVVREVYEEHGVVTSDDPDLLPAIGHRVEVIPTHCCYAVNLHDRVWVASDGAIEEAWDVAARGAMT